MNNENKKIGVSTIIIIILLLIIIGLLGYIIYDNKFVKESSTLKVENKEQNKTENKTTTKTNEGYTINSFTGTELTYELKSSGKKITFSQAKGNDINSGVEFVFDDYNAYGQIDLKGFYTLKSIGLVDSADTLYVVMLVSNDNGETAVFYSTGLTKYNTNSTDSKTMLEDLLDSFSKVEYSGNASNIGTAIKNSVKYPYITINNENYIIKSDGSIEKLTE